MTSLRWSVVAAGALLLICAPLIHAQQGGLHVGYVYPAGGRQGTTFEVVVAGQFMAGVEKVYVAGGGVQAEVKELIRPISSRELNELRIRVDELLARKAVVQGNFRALEQFRSFKTAKSVKKDAASDDDELAELKKKYANATWTAEDEKMLKETRAKMTGGVRRPANPAISEIAVVQITVAPDAQPGPRELRVATPTLLSNPLAFHIGQLPEFSKEPSKAITEQRSAIAGTAVAPKARAAAPGTLVTLPAVINGQILPGAVERYRFEAKQGQDVVIVAQARQLIPYIPDAVPGWFQATLAIYDAQGKEIAYDDDFHFDPDPVLHCQIPADGQYVMEIKDAIYRGREDFVYRITMGELPYITSIFPLGGRAGERTTIELQGWNVPQSSATLDNRGKTPGVYPVSVGRESGGSNSLPFQVSALPELLEAEPNNDPAQAQLVQLPVILNGRIGSPDDVDVVRFEGRAGSQIVAEVTARRLQSPLDSVLRLTDAAGRQVAINNDYEDKGAGLLTHHADSWLCATLPADGTYYLQISDAQHAGGLEYGYRLRIGPPQPDFELRISPSTLNIRAGAAVPFTVYALRRDGFSGEITLHLKDAPAGFRLSGGRVPSDQEEVRLTLTATASGADGPVPLRVEGYALIGGKEVCRAAVPAEDMMQAFAYRHLVPVQEFQVAVIGSSFARGAVQIVSDLPVRIPAGGTARVRFSTAGSAAASQLRLSDAPEGIEIQSVAPSRGGVEMVLRSDASKVKPGLQGNLILVAGARSGAAGKGKSAPSARSAAVAALPAVPFEIVAP